MTEGFTGYNILSRSQHIHLRVNHQEAFAVGNIHTNNIETFWATLKRGVLEIYHHVSAKFCFLYNYRGEKNKANPQMFDLVLKQAGLV